MIINMVISHVSFMIQFFKIDYLLTFSWVCKTLILIYKNKYFEKINK
jgi:hypothetical protein